MKQFLEHFKQLNKWQKLAVYISSLLALIACTLLSSCSSIRAGYIRTREIEQKDSTYVLYSQTIITTKSYNYGR